MAHKKIIDSVTKQGQVTIKDLDVDAMRNMLKDRPVFVRDGDRADTFIISTKQESREKRRQKVLDKLTAEERELLGV